MITENWYRAYFAALAGVCADSNVDDAISAVEWAAKVADTSETHLAERKKKSEEAARVARNKRIEDATKQVMDTKRYTYKAGGLHGNVTLEVYQVVDTTVSFLPNDANIKVANLFDVVADDEGFAPAPPINA